MKQHQELVFSTDRKYWLNPHQSYNWMHFNFLLSLNSIKMPLHDLDKITYSGKETSDAQFYVLGSRNISQIPLSVHRTSQIHKDLATCPLFSFEWMTLRHHLSTITTVLQDPGTKAKMLRDRSQWGKGLSQSRQTKTRLCGWIEGYCQHAYPSTERCTYSPTVILPTPNVLSPANPSSFVESRRLILLHFSEFAPTDSFRKDC